MRTAWPGTARTRQWAEGLTRPRYARCVKRTCQTEKLCTLHAMYAMPASLFKTKQTESELYAVKNVARKDHHLCQRKDTEKSIQIKIPNVSCVKRNLQRNSLTEVKECFAQRNATTLTDIENSELKKFERR